MRVLLVGLLSLVGLFGCQTPPGHQGTQHETGWQCLHGEHGASGHDYANCGHCRQGPH